MLREGLTQVVRMVIPEFPTSNANDMCRRAAEAELEATSSPAPSLRVEIPWQQAAHALELPQGLLFALMALGLCSNISASLVRRGFLLTRLLVEDVRSQCGQSLFCKLGCSTAGTVLALAILTSY